MKPDGRSSMFKEEVKSLVSGEDGVLLYKLPFHRSYNQKNFQRINVHGLPF